VSFVCYIDGPFRLDVGMWMFARVQVLVFGNVQHIFHNDDPYLRIMHDRFIDCPPRVDL
jgi:hypothetical protein